MGRPAPRGWRLWAKPAAQILAVALGPMLLAFTPLRALAEIWIYLALLAGWSLLMASLVAAMAQSQHSPLAWIERKLRIFVARGCSDPEALWLRWAREAPDPEHALFYLGRAVALGGVEARFLEGVLYLEGFYGPAARIDGLKRLEEAARQGHPEAAHRAAECLRTGEGCLPEPARALAWYKQAAAAGFGPAAAWLAHAYEVGDGVAADAAAARRYAERSERLRPHPDLTRSFMHHSADASEPLQHLRQSTLGLLEAGADRVLARRWGRWALGIGAVAVGGFGLFVVGTFFWAGSSQLHFVPVAFMVPPLLMILWIGRNLRRDRPSQRRDRLRKAAEGGDAEACFQLGRAHQAGTPPHPRDDLTAVLWLRRAAEAGHPGAMEALAQAYLAGHGVMRDPREAARWAEAAARQSTS